jgi:hypothetical protein
VLAIEIQVNRRAKKQMKTEATVLGSKQDPRKATLRKARYTIGVFLRRIAGALYRTIDRVLGPETSS